MCTYLSSAGDLRATPHPADFWFAAAQQFPKLSVIALAYLSVPCNSVAAERSFSMYTDVLRDDRRSIKGEILAIVQRAVPEFWKIVNVKTCSFVDFALFTMSL